MTKSNGVMRGCMAALIGITTYLGSGAVLAQERSVLREPVSTAQESKILADGTWRAETPIGSAPTGREVWTDKACLFIVPVSDPIGCRQVAFFDRSQISTTTPIMTTPVYATPASPFREPQIHMQIAGPNVALSTVPMGSLDDYPTRTGFRMRRAPLLFNRLRWRR